VVWQDQPNLIRNTSLRINNNFVEFEVKASDIHNGNAVIAVKNNEGTVMWSWHLWFAQSNALDAIPVENNDRVVYKFTRNTLGAVFTTYKATTYSQPRQVRVTVTQTGGLNQTKETAQFIITQKAGEITQSFATLYQFGRKDALPGTDAIAGGNFAFITPSGHSLGYAIQHPENLLTYFGHGDDAFWDWCNTTYINLWSANNTTMGYNDNPVVKTIYDPCPPGFKMPAPNAFTGFAKIDHWTSYPEDINISGEWHNGYDFNNKPTNPDASVYFPAVGYRDTDNNGVMVAAGGAGFYWGAIPNYTSGGCALSFGDGNVHTKNFFYRCISSSVRPVADN